MGLQRLFCGQPVTGTSPIGDYQRFAESMTTMVAAIVPKNIVARLRYQRSVVFIPFLVLPSARSGNPAPNGP
jgi:hypothetical protein